MQKIAATLLALILLSGCTKERLTAQMTYLSRKSLASYYVDTPDPCLSYPPVGQRLLITWRLPQEYPDLNLILTVRFNNHTEKVFPLKLNSSRGNCYYTLVNQDYYTCCGLQTYKVELYSGSTLLDCWKHQLYKDLIILNVGQKDEGR